MGGGALFAPLILISGFVLQGCAGRLPMVSISLALEGVSATESCRAAKAVGPVPVKLNCPLVTGETVVCRRFELFKGAALEVAVEAAATTSLRLL